MGRQQKRIVSMICVIAIFLIMALPVCANSLPDIWYGEQGNMTILMEKDCPIEVESELLTFDIQEFLKEEYEKPEDFLAYDGRVTAEYTFYNPTDSKITARLAFPFGRYPSAAEDPVTYEYTDDTEKYDITVNGEAIEKKLRYTYLGWNDFDAVSDKLKLRKHYIEDEFYKADMPVTKYTYDIMKNDVAWEELDVKCNVKIDSHLSKLYADKGQGVWHNEDGSYDIATYNVVYDDQSEKKTVNIYVIGEDVKDEVTWKFYDTTMEEYWDNEEEACVEGRAILIQKEQIALESLIFEEYNKSMNISKTDWYNAFVNFLKDTEWEDGIVGWNEMGSESNFNELLMRWYEYEITLAPEEKIVNTVTAPIYPTIDKEYNPACYEYMYLLSPAKLWNNFGSLRIVINTPYHMVGDSKMVFEKTETGYVLEREGLPEEELVFSLSESENPKLPFRLFSDINDIIFTAMRVGVALSVVIPVILLRRRRRKKR